MGLGTIQDLQGWNLGHTLWCLKSLHIILPEEKPSNLKKEMKK